MPSIASLVPASKQLPPLSEAEWQDKIVEVARRAGWVVAHFGSARTEHGWVTPCRYDGKGFPDCTLLHTARKLLVFVEFKTNSGLLTTSQLDWGDWIEAIEENSEGVAYYVWRPHAESEIIEYLTNGST